LFPGAPYYDPEHKDFTHGKGDGGVEKNIGNGEAVLWDGLIVSGLDPLESIGYIIREAVKLIKEPYKRFNGEKMKKNFNGEKTARLGTTKRPAVVSVQTEERLKEVASIFEEKGWHHTIGLEPDKPEDITDLEALLNLPKPTVVEKKAGRNDPCPCGSGKKYKKCCGK
jgi:SWIM/SEC-C metal-binding protein